MLDVSTNSRLPRDTCDGSSSSDMAIRVSSKSMLITAVHPVKKADSYRK